MYDYDYEQIGKHIIGKYIIDVAVKALICWTIKDDTNLVN